MFHLYRPFLLGEDDDDEARLWGGRRWVRGRWWYTLTHVCQRWKNIILGSASYLELSLVCTYGTHVADMLAYSPPFPLVVNYFDKDRNITTSDEEGIVLALKQRDRVHRLRLQMSTTCVQKFIAIMDEEYPILKFLVVELPIEDNSEILTFLETFQAPLLRHLRLIGFALPIGSLLPTTAVGLVTLSLYMVHPSTYLHPNALLQWISLIPQLEMLDIYFKHSIPSRDLERQLTHTPIIPPVTLPNLHYLRFHGASTYLDVLVHWIAAPRLEKLQFELFNQLAFSVPRLQQFINTTENIRFDSATFTFSDEGVYMVVFLRRKAEIFTIGIVVFCWHLDWQISSVAQVSNSLSQMFSAVDRLTLVHEVHNQSSEEHNEVDRTELRKLLRPFRNVKTFQIGRGLVKDISRCLHSEDGELPLEVLPELQVLSYYGDAHAFTSFIDARQNAGRPVTLIRRR